MNDATLFEVTVSWASHGEIKSSGYIVAAKNSLEALQYVWRTENPGQLRDVTVRWLCPLDCVGNFNEFATIDA